MSCTTHLLFDDVLTHCVCLRKLLTVHIWESDTSFSVLFHKVQREAPKLTKMLISHQRWQRCLPLRDSSATQVGNIATEQTSALNARTSRCRFYWCNRSEINKTKYASTYKYRFSRVKAGKWTLRVNNSVFSRSYSNSCPLSLTIFHGLRALMTFLFHNSVITLRFFSDNKKKKCLHRSTSL